MSNAVAAICLMAVVILPLLYGWYQKKLATADREQLEKERFNALAEKTKNEIMGMPLPDLVSRDNARDVARDKDAIKKK